MWSSLDTQGSDLIHNVVIICLNLNLYFSMIHTTHVLLYHTKCRSGRYQVSFTNKTDHHDITEILLKMALNTITLTLTPLLSH
jgi:hypothetical protein